ncbi:motile sperm domain-containing protein 2-like [Panonychus citri]|uniref:motile sperm domain-containing protein 2-like n=1 Tax=Panonychus citri TaxID=50023 RepID=UPI00230758E5|nr:motile sperm domain-containing protein 2-like [Panonychus citri]
MESSQSTIETAQLTIAKAPRQSRERTFAPVDQLIVENVRRRFIDCATEEPESFDCEEVEKIKTDDWPVYRFVSINNNNEEKSLQGLIATLRWRKKLGVRTVNENEFPDLIWRVGPLFLYEPDNQGRPTMYSRCKFVMGVKDISKWEQLFTAYQTWRIDEIADGNGWTLILDFADTGIRNADFDLLRFFLNLLMNHFPRGIDNILVINLPFILRMFWGLVKTWIPSDRVDIIKFVDSKSIQEYISLDRLPNFLGGNCTRPYKGYEVCPKGCPDVFEYGTKESGLPMKRMQEIYKIYEPLLEV